jgi:hypothetical protein
VLLQGPAILKYLIAVYFYFDKYYRKGTILFVNRLITPMISAAIISSEKRLTNFGIFFFPYSLNPLKNRCSFGSCHHFVTVFA